MPPASLYSVWAITGSEYEVLLVGDILLIAGIPFMHISYSGDKVRNKRNQRFSLPHFYFMG